MFPANRHQGWLYVWNGRDDRGTAGRVRTAVCARVLAADRVPNQSYPRMTKFIEDFTM